MHSRRQLRSGALIPSNPSTLFSQFFSQRKQMAVQAVGNDLITKLLTNHLDMYIDGTGSPSL